MLGEPDPVSDIDAGAVSFIGFAALQVLLSAAKSARRDGRALKFSNVSDAFRQSLDWMGLSLSDFESEGAASVN
jgi:anti-anti-sigma regulatory factor